MDQGYLAAEVWAGGSKRYISTYVMIFIIMVLLRSTKLLSRAFSKSNRPQNRTNPQNQYEQKV